MGVGRRRDRPVPDTNLTVGGAERRPAAARVADLAFAATFAVMGLAYLRGLGRFLINDDEGSYLYAAWRISLGEVPYRDFLTPQLPGFLYPGALIVALFGPDAVPARAAAAVVTLAAVAVVWWTCRRLLGPLPAALTGAVLIVQPDVFLEMRTFRPDPFMLLAAWCGFAVFARAVIPRQGYRDPPRRSLLMVSGALFGVGALTKLFAPFVLAGSVFWLLEDAFRARRRPLDVVFDLAVMGAAAAAVVVTTYAAFARTPILEDVLGHHLAQGADLPLATVVANGVAFFREYVRYHALEVFIALAAGWVAWREKRREATLFAWQLPTAVVFLALSRELFPRHLIYVLPAVAALVGWALSELWSTPARFARPAAIALAVAMFFPWGLLDRDFAWRTEDGTQRIADLVSLLTSPDQTVLVDNSELNFYSLRPTTYSAAAMSAGAASSGQITWRRISDELASQGKQPAMVLVDRTEIDGESYGHFRFLHDIDDFEEWLAESYVPLGTVHRRLKLPDRQEYEVWLPAARDLPLMADFGDIRLLAARVVDRPSSPTAGNAGGHLPVPGETVNVASAWQAEGAPAEDFAATVRLVDSAGREWAQADAGLLGAESRPTSEWESGELTTTRVPLTLPPGLPPATYTLTLAPYRRADGELLAPLEGSSPVVVGQIATAPASAGVPQGVSLTPPTSTDRVGAAQLLGHGPLPQTVVAGDSLVIDTWWRMASAAPPPALQFELSGDRGGTLERPGAPDVEWPAGTVFALKTHMAVLATAEGGSAVASVGEIGRTSDESAPAAPGAPIVLGSVVVEARDLTGLVTEVPPGYHTAQAVLGGVAELAGWSSDPTGSLAASGSTDAPPTAVTARPQYPAPPSSGATIVSAAGDRVSIDLAWRALAQMPVRLKVTLQVVDGAGVPVAQHDSEPADWTRPTTSWVPGEVILDRHELGLPEDLPDGQYRVLAGLYDPATAVRLPLAEGDDDMIELAKLVVGERP